MLEKFREFIIILGTEFKTNINIYNITMCLAITTIFFMLAKVLFLNEEKEELIFYIIIVIIYNIIFWFL